VFRADPTIVWATPNFRGSRITEPLPIISETSCFLEELIVRPVDIVKVTVSRAVLLDEHSSILFDQVSIDDLKALWAEALGLLD